MKTEETLNLPTIEDIEWTVTACVEETPIEGNALASGDDEQDKQAEDAIRSELEWNIWAWCCVRVTGRWNGLEASDSLGCCSYKDKSDFCQPGGYYQDMQATVLAEIQKKAETIVDAVTGKAVQS